MTYSLNAIIVLRLVLSTNKGVRYVCLTFEICDDYEETEFQLLDREATFPLTNRQKSAVRPRYLPMQVDFNTQDKRISSLTNIRSEV